MSILAEQLASVTAAFHQIQDLHMAEPRRASFGRRPQVEMRCLLCNHPAPCLTWQIAQTQLQKLAA